MALTYAAPTVGATAVAALSAGTIVAAFFDGESQRGRNFIPGAVSAGVASDNANTQFPTVVSATKIQNNDGVNGNQTGQVKLVLAPGSKDVVNVASWLTFYVDPNVVVCTVSGTF
jgi:aconitase A